MALTGDVDADIEVLLRVEPDDLKALCSVDTYSRDICKYDFLWKGRISQLIELPEAPPDDLTWRQYYFWLVKNYPDPIADALGMTSDDTYIRKITETGVIRGSEMFQSLRALLPKAAKEGNTDIIDYLFSLIDTAEFFNEANSWDDIADWNQVTIAAIEGHHYTLAQRFLEMYIRQYQRFSNESPPLKAIIRALGRESNTQFFDSLAYNPRDYDANTISFIMGLIEGGFIQESKRYLDVLNTGSARETYLLILPIAKLAYYKAPEILEWIYPMISHSLKARTWFMDDFRSQRDPSDVFSELTEYSPEKAVDYYYANEQSIRNDTDVSMTCYPPLVDVYKRMFPLRWYRKVNIGKCRDKSLVEDALISAIGDVESLLQSILDHARYDLIPLIVKYHRNNTDVIDILVSDRRYKDLILYFLSFHEDFDQIVENYIGVVPSVEIDMFLSTIVDELSLNYADINDNVFASPDPDYRLEFSNEEGESGER